MLTGKLAGWAGNSAHSGDFASEYRINLLFGLSQKNEALICKFQPQTSSLKETGSWWQAGGEFPEITHQNLLLTLLQALLPPCLTGQPLYLGHPLSSFSKRLYMSFKSQSALLSWGRHGTCPGCRLPHPPQASSISTLSLLSESEFACSTC